MNEITAVQVDKTPAAKQRRSRRALRGRVITDTSNPKRMLKRSSSKWKGVSDTPYTANTSKRKNATTPTMKRTNTGLMIWLRFAKAALYLRPSDGWLHGLSSVRKRYRYDPERNRFGCSR